MKKILSRLYQHETLTRDEAREVLVRMSAGEMNAAQMASFMTVYLMRNITVPEIEGFRDALLEMRVPIDLGGIESIDIVGTGGDGKNTFNISTCAAIVVAGAGYKVTKHGNNSASSVSGSSNVLQHFGYVFSADPDTLLRQLERSNFCFFHAPFFHPAMKAVAPVRRELGVKTFFNMLGPLVNPARPTHQLFGTFSLELSRLYQYILQESGQSFAVVYALDGYDEISLTGDVKVRTPNGESLLSPADFGKPRYRPEDLHGGDSVASAARIFQNVLENKATPAQKDVVIANAGMAISCLKPDAGLEACMDEARESIESGRAWQALRALVE
ncbi:MAG: anthranilate phosphoribosyltransferase [Bacteroidetes bacterium]|nr:MAG: anthranilate phosphoribosyltransferase [Bacteroidota bacterium]